MGLKVLAILFAAVLGLSSAAPILQSRATLGPYASRWGFTGNKYPIVMVHGLMGWGEQPLLGLLNYWGGLTTNLVDNLRDQGYTVHLPAVAPASSNWERACELYAQITGTVVDYGVARSKKFGHARFGRDYRGKGLYPEWGTAANKKIHLVGHSMGGPTTRMFAHLAANGYAEEVAASIAAGTTVSPLFWTNKTSSHISGVVSITGVLQGTHAVEIIENFADFIIDLVILLAGVTDVLPSGLVWDFQLSHWGLDIRAGEDVISFIKRVFKSSWATGKSNAQYDLAAVGSRDPANSWVNNSKDVYYFSVPCRTTGTLLVNDYALPDTLPFLAPFANALGTYTNTSLYGSDSRSWRPNDGLVPIKSQISDSTGGVDWDFDLRSSNPSTPSKPIQGKYQNVGVLENMDHIEIVGLASLLAKAKLSNIYQNIFELLYSLP